MVESFSHEHLPYVITAILLFLLLGVTPTIFLCLYQTRAFAKCSRFTTFRLRLNVRIFVETFQGCLRDGVNGGCDFRFLSASPMLLALVLAISSLIPRKSISLLACVALVVLVLSVSVAYVRPYKSVFMNLSMSFHLGVMGLSAGVATLWFEEGEMIDSRFLTSTFTLLAVLPHVIALITIVIWILRRIRWLRETFQKNFKLISGVDVVASESLPHRLIHSSAFNTM